MSIQSSRKPAIRYLILAAAVAAGVTGAVVRRGGPPRALIPGEMSTRAIPLHATMDFESAPAVIRFGTPASWKHQAHGFDTSVDRSASEPSASIRRRAEIRIRWASVDARSAALDLEVPQRSRFRALRLLLNGHRVARLELSPGRRRYPFELPVARQQEGVNTLTLVFGAEVAGGEATEGQREVGRAFGLAIGPPKTMAALAGAALPFSAWSEGGDIVQAGPSRLAWAVIAPGNAMLRFSTAERGGAPRASVEMENERGERTEVWRGGSAGDVNVPLPAQAGDRLRLWFSMESADGRPAWGTWKGLALTGDAGSPPPPSAIPPVVAASRPLLGTANVVVIVLDAAGARHFGCYGHPRGTTPNIDRIAAEGIVFERAYTPAVFTRSAMASMWTSQLPDEHHAWVSYDEPLPPGVPTLAGVVSAAGIATAAFVGNDMAGSAFGLDRGFSEFHRVSPRAAEVRATVAGWLARNAGRRFLAYVHYREPHYPFDPPPPFIARFGADAPLPASVKTNSHWVDRVNEGSHVPSAAEIDHLQRLYDANLAAVDHEVGALRQEMETLGIWDRTAVILTADHGEALYEHAHIGHNDQVHEESVHVPLIVRFPRGTLPGGRRVPALAGLLDVAPTVADILAIPKEKTATFRGRSLLAAAAGGTETPPEALLTRTVGARPIYGLVGARYTYHYDTRDGEERLYDLSRDPREKTSLIDAEPVRAAVLRQRLFTSLLALPGRSGPSSSGWSVPAEQRESLRALGYVQ